MKLLFDENLSPVLARRLVLPYATFTHVSQLDLTAADDLDIWAFAARENYVIVTKDKDFQQRAMLHGPPPQIVRLAIGNASLAQTEAVLRANLEAIQSLAARPELAMLLIDRDAASK